LIVTINNNYATAKIALQGAHIFHYQPRDQKPLLWLSELAVFEEGEEVWGGIPICWPWFGVDVSDQGRMIHGFARTQLWTLVEQVDIDEGTTKVVFELRENEATLALFPYRFLLTLTMVISDTLSLTLQTKNVDEQPFEITQAFHTYFDIPSVDNVKIVGLDGVEYLDYTDKVIKKQQGDINIDQEVNRVYHEAPKTLEVVDQMRQILIEQEGSNSTVVWNPWKQSSKEMKYMSNDGYKRMICVETANAFEDKLVIKPNETCHLQATYSIIR
jgi:glucose-6-phosphate 1-epimerase